MRCSPKFVFIAEFQIWERARVQHNLEFMRSIRRCQPDEFNSFDSDPIESADSRVKIEREMEGVGSRRPRHASRASISKFCFPVSLTSWVLKWKDFNQLRRDH